MYIQNMTRCVYRGTTLGNQNTPEIPTTCLDESWPHHLFLGLTFFTNNNKGCTGGTHDFFVGTCQNSILQGYHPLNFLRRYKNHKLFTEACEDHSNYTVYYNSITHVISEKMFLNFQQDRMYYNWPQQPCWNKSSNIMRTT